MTMSFYLHDTGMALHYEDIYEKFHSNEFQSFIAEHADDSKSALHEVSKRLLTLRPGSVSAYDNSIDVYKDVLLVIEEKYRSVHAANSAEFILKDERIKECLGIRCRNLLAEICRVHQQPSHMIMNLPYKDNGLDGDFIHPRFIASALCLGDLLDLDTDRFDDIVIKSSSPMPELSALHMKKHESVRHFLACNGVIEIISDSEKIEVYRVMRQWTDWINDMCKFLALNWSTISPHDFGNAPRISQCELLLRGNKKWLKFSDMHYSVSGKRMFEILKGSGIYRNRFVCIRELIQNAEDAVMIRMFAENILKGTDKVTEEEILEALRHIEWDKYMITGRISRKDNMHIIIEIHDNGTGVSLEDIERIASVSKMGGKKKAVIEKMPVWFRPSGVFGMGLQSVFMLTDEFVMITKTIDEPAKKITFHSADNSDGYIIIEDYNEFFAQGTTVRFETDCMKIPQNETGCSNYHFKTGNISRFVMRNIYSRFNNDVRNYPSDEERMQTYDYVPVSLNMTHPFTDEEINLLSYRALFAGEPDNIEICYGIMSIDAFIMSLRCRINCSIYSGHESEKAYEFTEINYHAGRSVFYRNVPAQEIFSDMYLFPGLSWSINILDGTAEDVLGFDRSAVREGYMNTLISMLKSAMKHVIKLGTDYMLSQNESRNDTGFILLMIYQYSRQYNYKHGELYTKYEDKFRKIKAGYYYRKGHEDKSLMLDFDFLRENHIYFIAGESIKPSSLPQKVKQSAYTPNIKKCFVLKIDNSIHVISHRPVRVFTCKIRNQYFRIIEAVPFERINELENPVEADDMILHEAFISSVLLRSRGIPPVSKYKNLITPLYHRDEFFIELPLSPVIDEMIKTLTEKFYVPNAYDTFFRRICESEIFEQNVKYITSERNRMTNVNSDEGEIRREYQKLVQDILFMLEDNDCIAFNRTLIKSIMNSPDILRRYNIYPNNPYFWSK